MKKNVSGQVIGAQMISTAIGATGLAFTGAVMVYVTGDGGTMAAAAGAASATHEGFGFHTYAPTQAETNYSHVAFTFATTNASPHTVQVYTNFPQTGDAYVGITAHATAITTSVAALPTAATNATAAAHAIWATALDGSVTAVQTMRLVNAAHAGKTTGMDTGTIVVRDINDSKNRISATADASGNRSAVSTDLT